MGLLDNRDRIRKDINLAIEVWKEFFEELDDLIEYSYLKGSAVKDWDSDIDYIPYISDLDIHVKVIDEERLTPLDPTSFPLAMNFTERYEKSFYNKCKKENHTSYHLPRIQVVQLNLHGGQGYNVPPREQDVTIIKGEMSYKTEFPHKNVRNMDMRNVIVEKDFIDSFPERFFYKSNFEYFDLLFKLASRVSPFPARLLNQFVRENPHDVWQWNRTKVVEELNKLGFDILAHHYKQYYILGWKLQETNFKDTDLFRQTLKYGYSVLYETYIEMYKINLR